MLAEEMAEEEGSSTSEYGPQYVRVKKDKKKGKEWSSLKFFVVWMVVWMTVATLAIGTFGYSPNGEVVQTMQQELYMCDAPFGTYWTDVEGYFVLFGGVIDSELRESYTVKYLVGDVLISEYYASTDPNLVVHLTDGGPMVLEKYDSIRANAWCWEYAGGPEIYHLYIPDPALYEEGE